MTFAKGENPHETGTHKGRGPEKFYYDRPLIAEAAGVSLAAVRKAEQRKELDVERLSSVAAFILKRVGWTAP